MSAAAMNDSHYVQSIWDVKQLLKEWKLENIWPHLMAEKIDGEILQMIKISHIRMLLGNFPLGIQIRFEHNLEQWRYHIGRPLQQHRCEGKCEFPSYKPSSTTTHRLFSDIPETHIPPAVEINAIQMDPKAVKRSSQSPKDPLLMNHHTPPDTPYTRSQASTPSSKYSSPMPYTSKAHGPVPKVNLREILLKCQPEGSQLMEIYKAENGFSRPERRCLVNTLVNYYLRDDLKFSLQTSYALERAILKMFPNERLDMYRKAKRGSIYCKYMTAKPLYTKKLQQRDVKDQRPNKKTKNKEAVLENSDMETTGCFSDDPSSARGRGGNRDNGGGYIVNDEDTIPTVSNMAQDDNDAPDDAKSQYIFSYVHERDSNDVKPTIIEDSEISIQTAYRLHREVIKMAKPFSYETFLTKACTTYCTSRTEDHFMTVNDCEINGDEFESVIRQYYKLPTFVVELKQRSSVSSELDLSNNDIDNITTEDDDVPMNILQTTVPDAKDIRNIPPLRHIVLLSNASKPLENKHRTAIAKAVIDECLSLKPDRTLKRQDYLTLAQNICEAFPGEKDTTYYVASQPNHPARGKLWSSFKNKRHFLSTAGVFKTRPLRRRTTHKSCEDESENSSNEVEDENTTDIPLKDLLDFAENSSLDFESIKTKWLETHQQRWQTLVAEKLTPSEYMQRYSILKSLQGINLMEIDMRLLYPQAGTIDNWMTMYTKVVEKMGMRRMRMTEFVKKLIKNIKESKDERYCASLALLLVPYLFPHNGRKNELSGERGTKLEIQERFIKEFLCLDDLRSDPNPVDLQLRYVHTDQRIIYAEFSISGFIFKCCDLLEALSCLFHYMKAMNIDYPTSCNHIWQFIQYAIFGIELAGVKWPYVESTISDLYLS